MPFRRIDRGVKERVIALLARGWTPSELADLMDVHERSIYRWLSNHRAYDSVVPPRSVMRGRPRQISGDVMHELLELLENMPELYLSELRQWLAIVHETIIGKSALNDALKDMGITYKLLRRDAAERNEDDRDDFRDVVWNQVRARMCVCLDESSKDNRTIYRHYGRAPAGQRAAMPVDFVRGERYSILPAMTVDGYIAVNIVEGSVDAEEFTRFVLEDVLPLMNPYPEDRSVLIMDNCKIHGSQILRAAVEAHGCRILPLPSYSPDLHPIEHSFSCVKSWIRGHYWYFINNPDPIHALHQACLTVTGEKAVAWFAHCGYRIDD